MSRRDWRRLQGMMVYTRRYNRGGRFQGTLTGVGAAEYARLGDWPGTLFTRRQNTVWVRGGRR